MKRALLIILSVIIADQALKVWVKLNMYYDSSISLLGDKGYLHFIENPGMAFGMELPTETGKLLLSLFRIAVLIGLGWYLKQQISNNAPIGLIVSLSLIFAGALGNIIDSAFYGMLFSESTRFQLAEFLPDEGGYASFLHGEVVDMFYFPLINGQFPEWIPKWGGEPFLFFRPVFNIADAAISVGVGILILFQRSFFQSMKETEEPIEESDEESKESVVST